MVLKIVEVPSVVYEVHDEDGEVYGNETGNCWDTYEEAQEVLNHYLNSNEEEAS